jgi:hypothetical protein
MVLPGLRALARGEIPSVHDHRPAGPTFAEHVAERQRARTVPPAPAVEPPPKAPDPDTTAPAPRARSGGNGRSRVPGTVTLAGAIASRGRPAAARPSDDRPRRRRYADNPASEAGVAATRRRLRAVERRRRERRGEHQPVPFPDRRLTRSAYEQVFLKLVSGGRLRIGAETYSPVGMVGWDQAVFRRDSDGRRRLLSIDQLLKRMSDWM